MLLKQRFLIQSFFILCLFANIDASIDSHGTINAVWTVIGAGPTGIMSVGLIMDSGVDKDKIVWIDPEFNVGRMGKYYQNIPGNGRVEQYIEYLGQCRTFDKIQSESLKHLFNLPLKETPELKILVQPLLDITQHLRSSVVALEETMNALDYYDNTWHIKTNNSKVCSENVVLATGAHPCVINYQGAEQIPLDVALDKEKLAQCVNENDIVAVIGSGHSAILLLKYLSELSVASIINFYKKPIVYPVPMRNGIAWKEAGLKGSVATWAKTVLETNGIPNLTRVQNSPESLQQLLPQCTKIIFAVGFERNELPAINGDQSIYEKYDRATGKIAPHLFGVGIAFPEEETDPNGNDEEIVGLPYLRFAELKKALSIQ